MRRGWLGLSLIFCAAQGLAQSAPPVTSDMLRPSTPPPHHKIVTHAKAPAVVHGKAPTMVHAKTPVVVARHKNAVRHVPAAAAKPAAINPAPIKPAMAAKPVAPRKPAVPANIGTNTGMALPRFAALKTDQVNMRSGPGERYPVLWEYTRRDLPVKIEREFDVWRLVEDMDGIKGWVHQATLTGRRSFIVTGPQQKTLRAEANDAAAPIAVLKPGVLGSIKSCDATADWCQVQTTDFRGFLHRGDFYGTLEGETVAP